MPKYSDGSWRGPPEKIPLNEVLGMTDHGGKGGRLPRPPPPSKVSGVCHR